MQKKNKSPWGKPKARRQMKDRAMEKFRIEIWLESFCKGCRTSEPRQSTLWCERLAGAANMRMLCEGLSVNL